MPLKLGELEIDGPAVLAPMAGYTDARFRLLCREQGCALGFTEMISAEGLMRSVRSTERLTRLEPGERPVGLQLYGHDPVRMGEAAARAAQLVEPDLIDINMGCPARKVVRKGSGVALMRDLPRALRIAEAVVGAVDLPVTVKIRIGWSARESNADELARGLQAAGCAAISVHGRTRAQLHAGPADWDAIGRIRDGLTIPVIGNGGVSCGRDARALMAASGVEAVMVGRAAVGNPWVFREIRHHLDDATPSPPTPDEVIEAVTRHLDGLIEANRTCGMDRPEGRACSRFRAHLVRYSAGRTDSVAFRRRLNEMKDRAAVLAAMRDLLRS